VSDVKKIHNTLYLAGVSYLVIVVGMGSGSSGTFNWKNARKITRTSGISSVPNTHHSPFAQLLLREL
jgi:hypothetical protein